MAKPFCKASYYGFNFQQQSDSCHIKREKIKNPMAEQHNSPQGCTVRVKAALDKAH